ncbi:MAG: MMPL family transporter [Aeromicrobium sp.]
MSTSLYTLGRWAYLHHRRVIAFWLAAIAILGIIAAGLGGTTKNTFAIPGTESQAAVDSLGRTFPQFSGASAYLIIVAPNGETIVDERSRGLITGAEKEIAKVDGVSEVVSPYSDLTPISISHDKRAAMIQIQFIGQVTDIKPAQLDALQKIDKPLLNAGYQAKFGGDAFTNTGPALSPTEAIGVFLAFIVLYLMFTSFRAALVPIATALVGVLVTMALTLIATRFVTISPSAPLLALMIGLAVGIDYALFILSRHREQLGEGIEPEEAAARAVATAGSAVVFAGATVVIALVGLAVARIPFLTVMGIVAAMSVLVAVAVALTLLPAIFAVVGPKLAPRNAHAPGGFSRRWVAATTRFPFVAIAIVVVGLIVVAAPARDLKLALPDNGTSPVGSTQRTSFDLVEKNFGPGFNGPLLITVDVISTKDPVGVIDDIAADIQKVDGITAIGLATPNKTGDTGVVQVIPTTAPSSERTKDLVNAIRDRAPGWEKEYGVDVAVTGLTAGGIDISQRLSDALLPFGLVVVGLSVLLLMIVFRSIVVPVKATIGFMLSTGASLGAVVAVFQWGWFASLVNLEQTGPLVSFLPIMLMAVLFGLSMDYEVFLMSRMKEEYILTDDAHRAIADGFVGSSRVVTSAAVIMLAVFAAFVPDGDPNIKPIAFALAIGVFADAFLIRMLFAPAVLQLFGRLAWVLPGRLDTALPHADIEGAGLHRQIDLGYWPGPDSLAAISAAGLTASGPDGAVFNDVNIDLPRGDWLVVHGPTGSGKTALLLTLAGRMAFDDGLLRINGFLLPQESVKVRKTVALGEFVGINDLEDNLTVDQHIAERLSIRSFGVWVRNSRITPVRDSLNDALQQASQQAGIPFRPLRGTDLISTLSRLEHKMLGVSLALITSPKIVLIEDVDDLRSGESISLLWSALRALIPEHDVTVVASVQSTSSAPPQSAHVHYLELNTSRTIQELMF